MVSQRKVHLNMEIQFQNSNHQPQRSTTTTKKWPQNKVVASKIDFYSNFICPFINHVSKYGGRGNKQKDDMG